MTVKTDKASDKPSPDDTPTPVRPPVTSQQLCEQALRLHKSGDLSEAGRLYRHAIDVDERNFRARHLLGIARFQQGAPDEALDWIQSALELDPDSVEALSNCGNVLQALERWSEALESYDRALAFDPHHAGALFNRGIALAGLRRPDEAILNYDAVLTLAPQDADAWHNRGAALSELERFEEALASYDKALAIRPAHAEALYNSGVALAALHRLVEARVRYDRTLALQPEFADALYNRGAVLRRLGDTEQALADFDRALAARPDFIEALNDRAAMLFEMKRPRQALEAYQQILALDPGDRYALGGAAGAALSLCDWEETGRLRPLLEDAVLRDKAVIPPFTLLGYSDDARVLSRGAENCVRQTAPAHQPMSIRVRRTPGKIRLAYLSSDFRDHAIGALTAELFECHDRARFDVLGISHGPDDGSALRQRLRQAFDRFHDVRNKSDAAVAALLKEMQVDIAIDLNGHTQGKRLGILGHRPCPIQATYMYPGPLGADYMDYVIADRIVLPFEQQPFYKERIVHLPHCYWVNDSRRAIAAATPSRPDQGLPDKGFVFCCFNNSWKITPQLFAVWMGLLADVPKSVLWLIDDNPDASANLRRQAEIAGIRPGRLVFAPRLPMPEHLARHRLADLFLDTLPYNAHTTASDALWAGLPVVTCKGSAFAGRVAASLLEAVGLPELVTQDIASYRALAFRFATDPDMSDAIRSKLAQNRLALPLFDSEGFRRGMEAALATMWQIAQRGEVPRSFRVEAR